MKIIAFNTSDYGSWIWIGEETPYPSLMHENWRFYSTQKLKIEKKFKPHELQHSPKSCFIAELSVEQLLTCNDRLIREWAVKQVEAA